ncbi:MAG: hypothetical protein AAFZ52_13180, partial [Bacteroidota bacterium]
MGAFIIKEESLFGEVFQQEEVFSPTTQLTVAELLALRVGEEVRKNSQRLSFLAPQHTSITVADQVALVE